MSTYKPVPAGLDDGHVHEFVDRLFVAIAMVEDHIANHPLAMAIPSLDMKVRGAIDLLASAYQEGAAVGETTDDDGGSS